MESTAIDFLLSTQARDGGWGYLPDQNSTVEPSSSVIIALQNQPNTSDACDQAIKWLIKAQNKDGGWGISLEDHQSGWQTAWALLALARYNEYSDVKRRAIEWLLTTELFDFSYYEAQAGNKELFSIDPSLRGWPWLPGEASWVEPTALSIFALRSATKSAPKNDRIKEAVIFLKDRRCREGGWNIGSPSMFSKDLTPRSHSTALALIALKGVAPDMIQSQDIRALRMEMNNENRALAFAWGSVALQSLDENDEISVLKLKSMQKQNGSWDDNINLTAIAFAAMNHNFLIKN